jgi:hypothetical protein
MAVKDRSYIKWQCVDFRGEEAMGFWALEKQKNGLVISASFGGR